MSIIPPLIYGTAWKKEKTAELVEKAILSGFRGIDTACQPKHYHEEGVGEALERLVKQNMGRKDLFIQTKFTPLSGQDPNRIPYDPHAPLSEQVKQSFSTSLKNLKIEFIDSLLLHSPLNTHEQTMQAWQSMEELHKKGAVGVLGISNCYDLPTFKLLYEEAKIKPSVLQNRFYNETGYDKILRKWCLERNVSYQSFWTLTANPQILNHPHVIKMAFLKEVTEAQLFFRFLTQQNIIPLIGSCSEKHMQEDLAIFDFSLTEEEMITIDSLLSY
jgi:diketogulonate reductase-like aldo/keto reductase